MEKEKAFFQKLVNDSKLDVHRLSNDQFYYFFFDVQNQLYIVKFISSEETQNEKMGSQIELIFYGYISEKSQLHFQIICNKIKERMNILLASEIRKFL